MKKYNPQKYLIEKMDKNLKDKIESLEVQLSNLLDQLDKVKKEIQKIMDDIEKESQKRKSLRKGKNPSQDKIQKSLNDEEKLENKKSDLLKKVRPVLDKAKKTFEKYKDAKEHIEFSFKTLENVDYASFNCELARIAEFEGDYLNAYKYYNAAKKQAMNPQFIENMDINNKRVYNKMSIFEKLKTKF